jgi:hypothetical protein
VTARTDGDVVRFSLQGLYLGWVLKRAWLGRLMAELDRVSRCDFFPCVDLS